MSVEVRNVSKRFGADVAALNNISLKIESGARVASLAPFGSLGAKVRKELRQWLRKLHEELHITTLFVTHDQEEALEVAGRVAILRAGRVEQIGTPDEIYDHPASPFIYD